MSRFVWVKFWVSKSPPTFAWTHWPQRDHSKRFGVCKAFLKCLLWSTHFGPSNSGHFFSEPQRKCSLKIQHLLGYIRYSPSFRWILGLRSQQEPFTSVFWHSNVPVNPWPWPTAPLKVVNFFQLENPSKPARNGLQPTFMRFVFDGNHAVLYRWKRMSFAQLVGTMLRFDLWDANPEFSHCTGGGSIPRDLTVRWKRLWIFILIQLHSALQLSIFAHFAVLWQHRVEFLFLQCFWWC